MPTSTNTAQATSTSCAASTSVQKGARGATLLATKAAL